MFFNLPPDKTCIHPGHNPAKGLYIPPGKGYRHVCPGCKTVTGAIPHQPIPKPSVNSAPASHAPKVTPADVEAAIASEHYYTGAGGASNGYLTAEQHHALSGLMHCTLICTNGQLATGEAFCADLSNPDHERARAAARRRAFDKLYDMVVYEARTRCLATSK